jgi:Protein of unknown function (DUF3048) N-terminal domain/Protein of unknown function (DUF3048) C-terminal domain
MEIKMSKYLIVATLLALALSACNAASPIPQGTPSQGAPEATATSTSQPPTLTPLPPTETPTPTGTSTPTATATLPPQDYGPDNFPPNVNPLTGLPVANPALLERRPIAVKVQIFPRGQRPPWGLSLADIVYDYYQNNGLTRFHVIFYGNDAQQVGPVRSARYFDDNLIRMYKEIFAFGGADQRVLNRLFYADYANRLVVEGSSTCPALCRIDPNGFNFLIANTAEIGKYAAGKGVDNVRQNLNGMTFKYQPPANGKAGTQVFNRYSISAYDRWDYDPVSGRYLRFQDTQEDTGIGEAYAPLMDRLTNQQIAAANVVIILAPHTQQTATLVDIALNGSGTAYAFRDGQMYEVKWNRPKPDSVLYLTYPNGTPYPFKSGNTWYQVMGQSTKLQETTPGVWRFENRLP